MFREIKLLTTDGEKSFPMLANGATAVRYRQVFHTDLIAGVTKFSRLNVEPDKVDFELPGKLGYIMNSAAEKKDMNTLSEDGYMEWLEQFEGDTLWSANGPIMEIYLVNQTAASEGKK